MVERVLAKHDHAGSIPVSCSNLRVQLEGRALRSQRGGSVSITDTRTRSRSLYRSLVNPRRIASFNVGEMAEW